MTQVVVIQGSFKFYVRDEVSIVQSELDCHLSMLRYIGRHIGLCIIIGHSTEGKPY